MAENDVRSDANDLGERPDNMSPTSPPPTSTSPLDNGGIIRHGCLSELENDGEREGKTTLMVDKGNVNKGGAT